MSKKKRGLTFYTKEKKRNKGSSLIVIQYVGGVIFAVLLASLVYYYFGMSTWVVGSSMEPSVYEGEEVLIDRFSTLIKKPSRGDVIVFYPNGNESSHLSVKRVIGLPGETIYISEGRVYINNSLFEEDYSDIKITDSGIASGTIKLKDDEFFVLGDNRNNSEDSRSANLGTVSKDDIYGKIWFKKKCSLSDAGFVK